MIMAIKSAIAALIMWWSVYWHVVLAALVLCWALFIIVRPASPLLKRFLALIPAMIAAAWLYYSFAYPWHVYRYKLTVDLDVDGETVSKSEIYEVRRADTPLRHYLLLGAPTTSQETIVRGEAIYFDLGEGRPLLVTMSGSNGPKDRTALSVLAQEILGIRDWKSPALREATQRGTKKEVPSQMLPWMITFDDLNDPDSLRVVGPNNLSQEFDRNVSVKSAWLQMTTDRPDDSGVSRLLPWLRTIDRPFPGKVVGNRVTVSGNKPTFSREVIVNDNF